MDYSNFLFFLKINGLQQFFVFLNNFGALSFKLGPLSYCFLAVQDKVEKQGKDEVKLWETMLLGLWLHDHPSLLMRVLASSDESDHFLRNGIVKVTSNWSFSGSESIAPEEVQLQEDQHESAKDR